MNNDYRPVSQLLIPSFLPSLQQYPEWSPRVLIHLGFARSHDTSITVDQSDKLKCRRSLPLAVCLPLACHVTTVFSSSVTTIREIHKYIVLKKVASFHHPYLPIYHLHIRNETKALSSPSIPLHSELLAVISYARMGDLFAFFFLIHVCE